MKLLKQISLIEQLDQLIRLRATGNLDELSKKLNLSVSTVKRQIEVMKQLGAPVFYNHVNQRYEYRYHVNFIVGFSYIEEAKGRKKIKFKLCENEC